MRLYPVWLTDGPDLPHRMERTRAVIDLDSIVFLKESENCVKVETIHGQQFFVAATLKEMRQAWELWQPGTAGGPSAVGSDGLKETKEGGE